MTITLKDGTEIFDHHDQDCCEAVYADWPEDIEEDLKDVTLETLKIEYVEDFGFKINGISVSCHNSQNGYYSDQLDLIVRAADGTVVANHDLTDNCAIQHEVN